jgi:hypothetical protein
MEQSAFPAGINRNGGSERMRNTTKVKLFQMTPETSRRLLSRVLRRKHFNTSPSIHGIDHFPTTTAKTKRALLALSPDAWLQARRQYPNIRLFNYTGLSYEIVKALNRNGYLVDIVDYRSEHSPTIGYDLFVGHGGNCRTIIDSLPVGTPILQYVSGAHWAAFNTQSEARYRRFAEAHGHSLSGRFKRSLDGLIEGEEYLSRKATYMFTIQCPRMVATYGDLADKFVFTGLGAYEDLLLGSPDLRTHCYRNRFLYLAGTGGNIQKGLDLFVDVFSKNPDLELYVYCKVESEILDYASHSFNTPNIHYIYHWRHQPFHRKLHALINTISFTLHAPIDAGLGTAFSASLASGLIPVGYVDYTGDPDYCILSKSWGVDALATCVHTAAKKSHSWCRGASDAARRFYDQHCTPNGFYERFHQLVCKVT